jgi:hypothetical protein
MDLVREAIEIELHPKRMNREVGFCRESRSSAPSRNMNMMPDLQGYAGQYMLGSCRPEATGSVLGH